MIISIDAKKASDKIQHHFIIKILRKLGTEGKFHNYIKGIYENPQLTSHSMVNDLKAFPLRLGARQGCPFSPLLSILY